MTKPREIGGGRWVVNRSESFVNWCAWRYWLHRETGRTVFLEKQVVWGEWPPESLQGAQIVCDAIREARRAISYDYPVCSPAQPWDRWSYNEREDMARRHREDFFWNPDLPETRISRPKPGAHKNETRRELDAWTDAECAKLPPIKRGQPLPNLFKVPRRIGKNGIPEVEAQEPEPIPYVETPDEVKIDRMAALHRRLQSQGY